MSAILKWLIGYLLDWLLTRLMKEVQKRVNQIKSDEERQVRDDANVKAYEEAVDRVDRVKAALDLLNRN